MGKNLNKEKSISDMLSEIENNADLILKSGDSMYVESAENIKENTKRINKYIRGVIIFMFSITAFFIIAAIAVVVLIDSNRTVQRLNEELILTGIGDSQDSLKDKILLDKEGSIIYRVDSLGKPVTYQNLVNQNDVLKQKLRDTKFLLDFASQTYDIKFDIKKVDNNKSYKITSKTIDDLRIQNDELIENNLRLQKENYELLVGKIKGKVDSIKRK